MLVLAFDTSSPAVTVALGTVASAPDGVTVIAEQVEIASNRHGELLAPLIQKVLAAGDAAPGDLDAVAVGLGPGPFTGLRVGIVTAKAMADSLGIPSYGESSLALIADDAGGVATNARRKQVYWAVLGGGGFDAGPDIGTPEQAAAQFRSAGITRVVGEGPVLYPDAFAAFTTIDDEVYPRAGKLIGHVAQRVRDGAPGEELVPMYLRRPDAVPPGKPKRVTPV